MRQLNKNLNIRILLFVLFFFLFENIIISQDAENRKVYIINGVRFAVHYIPPGTFIMGTDRPPSLRRKEETARKVTLTKGFWIMETEVTQELYESIMGTNPSQFSGKQHPAENISWYDAINFCTNLSKATNMNWSLPTEAEWEYACRAGSKTMYSFGDLYQSKISDYACISINRYNKNIHHCQVGKYKPNNWGLYDMHGNVWEWCSDWYGEYQYNSVVDPHGPDKGYCRVLRGGSWLSDRDALRSAYRNSFYPHFQSRYFGFRAVMREK